MTGLPKNELGAARGSVKGLNQRLQVDRAQRADRHLPAPFGAEALCSGRFPAGQRRLQASLADSFGQFPGAAGEGWLDR